MTGGFPRGQVTCLNQNHGCCIRIVEKHSIKDVLDLSLTTFICPYRAFMVPTWKFVLWCTCRYNCVWMSAADIKVVLRRLEGEQ